MRATATVTFQPTQQVQRILSHITRRVARYGQRGGQTRAICEAVEAVWGPVVMNGRSKYLKRKIKETI